MSLNFFDTMATYSQEQDFDSSVSSDATDISVSLLNDLDLHELSTTRQIDNIRQSKVCFNTSTPIDHEEDAYNEDLILDAQIWNSLTRTRLLRKFKQYCEKDFETPASDLEADSSEDLITSVNEVSSDTVAEPELLSMLVQNRYPITSNFKSNTTELCMDEADLFYEDTMFGKQHKLLQSNYCTPKKTQEHKLDNTEDLPQTENVPKDQKYPDELKKQYATPIRMYLTVSPKTNSPPVGIVLPNQRYATLRAQKQPLEFEEKKSRVSEQTARNSLPIEGAPVLFRRSVPKRRAPRTQNVCSVNNFTEKENGDTCRDSSSAPCDQHSKYNALMHEYLKLEKKMKKEKKKRKLATRKLVLQNFNGSGKCPATLDDDQKTLLLSNTMSAMFRDVKTMYPENPVPPAIVENMSRLNEMEKEAVGEEVRRLKRDCDCLCFCGDSIEEEVDISHVLSKIFVPATQQSMLMFSQTM